MKRRKRKRFEMYRCDNGHRFEAPAITVEDHGETWKVCPACGEYDCHELGECLICGEESDKGRLVTNCGVCLGCEIKISKHHKYVIEREFSGFELEFLKELNSRGQLF